MSIPHRLPGSRSAGTTPPTFLFSHLQLSKSPERYAPWETAASPKQKGQAHASRSLGPSGQLVPGTFRRLGPLTKAFRRFWRYRLLPRRRQPSEVIFFGRSCLPGREGLLPDCSGHPASVVQEVPPVRRAQWCVAVGEADIGGAPRTCQLAAARNFAGVGSGSGSNRYLPEILKESRFSTGRGAGWCDCPGAR
jgi:hypothetical protein